MKKIIRWVAAATIIGALAGCARTAPIEQIHSSRQVPRENGLCQTLGRG